MTDFFLEMGVDGLTLPGRRDEVDYLLSRLADKDARARA